MSVVEMVNETIKCVRVFVNKIPKLIAQGGKILCKKDLLKELINKYNIIYKNN